VSLRKYDLSKRRQIHIIAQGYSESFQKNLDILCINIVERVNYSGLILAAYECDIIMPLECDVKQCNMEKVHRRCRGNVCLHL